MYVEYSPRVTPAGKKNLKKQANIWYLDWLLETLILIHMCQL